MNGDVVSACVVKCVCGATYKISITTHPEPSAGGTSELALLAHGVLDEATQVETHGGRGLTKTQLSDRLPILESDLFLPAITKTLVQLRTSQPSKAGNVLQIRGIVSTRIVSVGYHHADILLAGRSTYKEGGDVLSTGTITTGQVAVLDEVIPTMRDHYLPQGIQQVTQGCRISLVHCKGIVVCMSVCVCQCHKEGVKGNERHTPN